MNNAMRKDVKSIIPPREKGVILRPRPALGDHKEQLECATAISTDRYEKAFEALAKV
jgi:hypothetical protein